MVLITIVTGAYKPTYNSGGPHCMNGVYSNISNQFFLSKVFMCDPDRDKDVLAKMMMLIY